jgi:hypothetical protein
MGWATFWAIFSQTHLVPLKVNNKVIRFGELSPIVILNTLAIH